METQHHMYYTHAARMDPVASQSVDLVVTSPPYPMIEMWDDLFGRLNPAIADALSNQREWQAFELMHAELDPVWNEVHRILKPGGIACINVGDATRSIGGRFALFPNHARIVDRLINLGFSTLPAIIWRKPTNSPTKFMGSGMLPPSAYVTLEHEMILIARKGDRRKFTISEESSRRRMSAYFWEERNVWFSDVWLDVKGTLQEINGIDQRSRSAAFPFEVPYRLISMFSIAGDTVVDPFCGIGTTCAAAVATARNSVGFEIDPGFREAIAHQITSIPELAAKRSAKRLTDHLDFIRSKVESGYRFKHVNAVYGFSVMTRQEVDLCILKPTAIDSFAPNSFKALHGTAPLQVQRRLF